MVDAEDLRFVEDPRYRFVDLPRGVQVPADRLFDDDPRKGFVIADRLGKARLPQTFYREDDCRRGNGEIKDAVSRQGELGLNIAEARAQIQIRLRLGQSPGGTGEALLELRPDGILKRLPRVLRHSLSGKFSEIVIAELCASRSDHGVIVRQGTIQEEIVQGRQKFPAREIPGAAEDHEGARLRLERMR